MHPQLIKWTLRRRPWRNVLIMASVALTVAVMTVFFSTQLQLSKFLARVDAVPYQRFWVKPRNLATREIYPLAMQTQLAAVPGVSKVLYVLNSPSETPDKTSIFVQGAADGLAEVERDFFPVDDATIKRWDADPNSAVVGDIVADKMHLTVGSLTELPTPGGPLKITVAGISRGSAFGIRVLSHYKQLDQLLGNKGVVSDYRIVLDKKTDSHPVVKAVDEILKQHGLSSHLLSERTMMQLRGAGSAGLIPSLLGALGLVLLLTTAMAITNAAVISVRERREELATLRVLGFKKRSIASLIVTEIFIVCILGAAIGTGIAWLAMRGGMSLGSQLFFSVNMTSSGVLAGVGSCLLVAVAGSGISAWLAIRAPLATALRDAG